MGTAPQVALQLTSLPQTRVFGDDLAPPRSLYITHIPAILVFTGILAWVMGDEPGMLLASAVAAAIGLYSLWGWLLRKAPTRFSTLMSMGLLLGYGAGALNTWATLPRGSLTIAAFKGLSEGVLARGIGAVLISSAALFFFGEIFEKPVFGRDFRFHIDERTRTLIYAGTLAMVAGFASHSLAIEGAAVNEGHVSILGVFLSWLYIPLTAVAVTAFLTAPRLREKVPTGLSALILLLMFSVMGRRTAIYTSIVIVFVLGLSGYQLRGRMFRKVFLALSLAAVIIACSLTFMLLRIASNGIRGKQVTVGKRIAVAGKLFQRGGAYALAGATTQKNVQSRTFVLAFFANVLDASSRKTPALGRDVAGFFQDAIPSILYPDKDRFFTEEGLVDEQFGFSYGDEANSVLTAGATDFGFIGVIIYPLVMILLIRLFYNFTAAWLRTTPLMFVALSIIFLMLAMENTLGSYFEVLRDSFFFGIMLALFMALPRVKLRTQLRYD
jgi:hypothetical protein